MRILTFVNFYFPGFRGGGPIRSIFNLTERLGEELEFQVVTTDRDFLDSAPYAGVRPDTWQRVRNVNVFYAANGRLNWLSMVRLIRQARPDVIYLNSFFHRVFAIPVLLFRLLRLIPRVPVVLAPRGELSPGALAIKPYRKLLYFRLASMVGMYDGLTWQASCELEAQDIRSCLGLVRVDVTPIIVAPDLIAQGSGESESAKNGKECGSLRMVFVSRISRMKNLSGALTILRDVKEPVTFDIYGPIDDAEYWKECGAILQSLPPNIEARYRGEVAHDQVNGVFSQYDLLFLPTKGENFGHVIVESLLAGCPVLISDRTPWRGLEAKQAGKDLALEDPTAFTEAIHGFWSMTRAEYAELRQRVRRFGIQAACGGTAAQKNREMFWSVVRG